MVGRRGPDRSGSGLEDPCEGPGDQGATLRGGGGGGWCQKEQVKGREDGCLGGVGCDVHILTFLRKRVEVYC